MALSGCWDADKDDQEALYPELLKKAMDWEVLLQVTSGDQIGMYWLMDYGILYFMIKREDLIERRFDRVMLLKQYS